MYKLWNTNDSTYKLSALIFMGFPGVSDAKELACQCKRHKRRGFDPWIRNIRWRRAWPPTKVFLPGESYGQRSLVGHKDSDTTKVS